MLYRILTEDKAWAERGVAEIVLKEFDGFTMLRGVGFWKGGEERCLIIEIFTADTVEAHDKVARVAKEIKAYLEQESVLIQRLECGGKFI